MAIHLRVAAALAMLVASMVAATIATTTTSAAAIAANGSRTAMPRLIASHAHAIVVEEPEGRAVIYEPNGRPAWSPRNEPMLWPTDGTATSEFGWRSGRMHKGLDIGADTGTPIVAARTGRVIFSGWKGGYGNTIDIDHGGGVVTRYAHLSANRVARGQRVAQGGLIGRVGMTGSTTGPHLHFEVRIDGQPRDPRRMLHAP